MTQSLRAGAIRASLLAFGLGALSCVANTQERQTDRGGTPLAHVAVEAQPLAANVERLVRDAAANPTRGAFGSAARPPS